MREMSVARINFSWRLYSFMNELETAVRRTLASCRRFILAQPFHAVRFALWCKVHRHVSVARSCTWDHQFALICKSSYLPHANAQEELYVNCNSIATLRASTSSATPASVPTIAAIALHLSPAALPSEGSTGGTLARGLRVEQRCL